MSFQTPGGHDAKRRRIEAANATLRKPFRSPLVNRQQHETPGPAATDSVTPHTPAPARGSRHASNTAPPLSTSPTLTPWSLQPKEQAAATAATKSLTPRPGRTPLPIKNQATPRPQPQQRPRPGSQCTKRGGAPATATTATQPAQGVKEELQKEPGEDEEEDDEDLLTRLTTAQRTLHSHLRAAQSRLALVRQAAQIERRASSSATERPGEPAGVDLTGLIGKWKGASRLAAEEVFGLVRGRVEGMGGVRAWRESQRRQRAFYAGGFDEVVVRKGGSVGDGQDEDGEWGGEGEGEMEAGEREEEEQEEGEESEEFTMIVMLQSLNIDPDVLGYDPVEDRWRD